MMTLNSQTTRIFLIGILCVHLVVGRSIPGPAWDPSAFNGPVSSNFGLGLGLGVDTGIAGGLNIGGGFGGFGVTDFSISTFSDILFNQLAESNVFRNFFSSPITTDLSLNIGLAISQSLVAELGVTDSYLATSLLSSALTSVIPGSGPEAYGRALANTAGKILLNNNILNSSNCSSLANTLARIILNAVSVSLYGNIGVNVGAGIGLGADLGAVVATGVNTNIGSNIGVNDFGYSASPLIDGGASILGGGLDINAGLGLDTDLGLGVGVDAGIGLGIGANAGLGIGAGAGLGIGANVGLGAGIGVNAGLDIGAGLGIGTNAGLGVGAGLGLGVGAGLGIGAGAGLGTTVNTGIGAGLNVAAGVDTSLGVSVNTDLDVGLALGANLGVDTNADVGLNIDFSVSDDAIALFKAALKAELLKDKFFRDVFSDYIPPSALKQIGAAISQYLSKAFSLPRSFLLPLETAIGNLTFDVTPSAELYAGIISNSIATLFSSVNFITKGTALLQWTIAANAITSGIANFLGISTIPGIGLGVNGNAYNSYFSVLNGLEKLPYVGIDAVSSTLPPVVKTVQASAVASRFSKTLFYNLISSNKFSEVFSLGVPTYTYKIIASTLGKFMAEAFGSSDSAIFTDIYTKALVTTIDKLNCRTYARALSLATTKALYLLGYFLSGNVNIQAAIATNAIIRTLITRLRPVSSQVTLFPKIRSLPWVLQLAGVIPSQTLAKFGIGADASVGLGLGVDVGANAAVGLGLGIDTDVGVGAGLGVDVGLGVGAGLGLGVGLGVDAGLGVNAGVGAGLGAGLGLDLGVGAGLGLGIDAGVGAGLGLNAGLGVGAGLGVNAGVGLGLGTQANTGLGVGLGLDAGLGLGLGTNVGVDAGLGLGVTAGLGLSSSNGRQSNRQKRAIDDILLDDLDFDFDADFDLEAELEAELELGLLSDINLGVDLGVDADIGLGAKIDAAANAAVDVGANVGANVKTNVGVGAGLGLGSNLRAGTGVGLGAGLGVGLGLGLDASGGVSAGLDAAAGVQTGIDLGFTLGPKPPTSPNVQLSVLNVLPQILANKLYQSTTLYTSVSMVGTRKVVNLIAQALASGFGLPIASIFLRSYNQYSANNVNNSFGISTIALALSTTEALAGAGILNSPFSVLTADQLATAVVAKFSSLIATSLDTKDLGLRPRWTYIFSQDQFQPPLAPGYNIFK